MFRATARWAVIFSGVAFLLAAKPTTGPSTAPTTQTAAGDSATDWLLGAATTPPGAATNQTVASTTQPHAESPPVSPLVSRDQTDPDRRHGTITLGDGTVITGEIATTLGKPLRTWDEQAGEYRDAPMRLVKSIKAQVLWERDEPEWRFKESGSDIKINTGKTYPARETSYTITLLDGKTIKGGIVAPLYVRNEQGEQQTYILHKRDKGEVGQTLKQLVYVAKVEFDDPAK